MSLKWCKKKRPSNEGLYYKESFLSILLAEVGMRSRNGARSGIISTCSAHVNHVDIATDLTMAEDQAVCADALLQGQVVDDRIYAIPAELLAGLGRLSVRGYDSLASGSAAEGSSQHEECTFSIFAEGCAIAFEVNAGELYVGAGCCRRLNVAAALGIRALTYTVSINRLALGRRDELLVFAVRYTVTIRVAAHTVRINRATSRRLRLAVELVGNTITISIIQHRLRHFHALGGIQLAVSEIQGIQPVEGLNRLVFLAKVEIQTCGQVVIRIKVASEGSITEGMLLPALTVEEIILNEGHAIFNGEVDAGSQLEGYTCTNGCRSAGGVVTEDAGLLCSMALSRSFVSVIQQVTECLADVSTISKRGVAGDAVEVVLRSAVQGIHEGLVPGKTTTSDHIDIGLGLGLVEQDVVQGENGLKTQIVNIRFVVVIYIILSNSTVTVVVDDVRQITVEPPGEVLAVVLLILPVQTGTGTVHELKAQGGHVAQRLADMGAKTDIGHGAHITIDVKLAYLDTKFPLAAGLGRVVILVVQELALLCSPGSRDNGGVPPVVTGS